MQPSFLALIIVVSTQTTSLKKFLGQKVDQFNRPDFIKDDPISVPHKFLKKQDIEIAGFFASIFAWGNRTTIIRKSTELMELMDNSPSFQHIGILSLEFHVDKLSRPLL